MKPTPALIESGMPRSSSAATPPVKASGTPLKTSSASAAEPRLMNSSSSTSSSATGTTMVSRLRRGDQLLELPAPADPVARPAA